MLQNFSFVIDGQLAGSACPGIWRELRRDLEEAHEQGITALVTLTERSLDEATVAEAGLDLLHLPMEDFGPPTMEQMARFVGYVERQLKAEGAVLVHCLAGQGRTGTMLAAYLIAHGHTALEAMARVRELRPGSIESASQELALDRYEEYVG